MADYTRLELLDDCVCRKCSLLGTLERVREDIGRIGGGSKLSPSSDFISNTNAKGKGKGNAFDVLSSNTNFNTNGDAHIGSTTGTVTTKSESKKRRMKELKRVEKRLVEMLEEGRIEEDVEVDRNSSTVSQNHTITGTTDGGNDDDLLGGGGGGGEKEKSKKRLKKEREREREKERVERVERVVSRCSTRQSMVARVSCLFDSIRSSVRLFVVASTRLVSFFYPSHYSFSPPSIFTFIFVFIFHLF